MEFSKKQLGIFYIENNKAFFYSSLLPSVLQLDFPQDTIHDLEIVNRKGFDDLLGSFCESNGIQDFTIAIVLAATITFEKSFEQETDFTDQAIQTFLEIVPFEDVISKVYTINKTRKIIAGNRQVSDGVQVSFENHHNLIAAVIPYTVLQMVMPELVDTIDLQSIESKFDAARQYSFYGVTEGGGVARGGEKQGKNNTRVLLLAGVFFVLLLVLGIMVYFQIIVPSQTPPKKIPVTNHASASPTVAP